MAERTHYWAYIVGSVVITALIYAVYGSWAWGSLYGGQGWLKQMGFIDFAGSTVVHEAPVVLPHCATMCPVQPGA